MLYNGAMPLPATLVASIVSAILETAAQSSTTSRAQYEAYVVNRTLPPAGDGRVTIDGKAWPLAPAVQFRSQQNLIVMPMTIQDQKNVVFLAGRCKTI